MYNKTIFIFRRDHRLHDNIALINACEHSKHVIPIFIFDPCQVKTNHKYTSNNSIQFMCESLKDLDKQLRSKGSRLHYFYGRPWQVIDKLLTKYEINCISFNRDFSKYSLYRDKKLIDVCKQHDIEHIIYDYDLTLHNHERILKKNMYVVFSAFYKNALKYKVTKIQKNTYNNYISSRVRFKYEISKKLERFYNQNNNICIGGGRTEAFKILRKISKHKKYNKHRDLMSCKTTQLSAYLKFGCVSIRECYHIFRTKLPRNTDLTKQLYWRSFYFLIAKHKPRNYNEFIDTRFSKLFSNIKPSKSLWLKLWTGNTGFLAIDAAIRELNTTGFMHNRGRLLVGNFSVKILRLNPFHPKWGGQIYFSKKLIDCCYANNMGNWSWVTGDKLDGAGMRFGKGISGRVFDPRKFEKWDPICSYIKTWIPQLSNISNKDLFNWDNTYMNYKVHVKPCVDFAKRKQEWINIAKKF